MIVFTKVKQGWGSILHAPARLGLIVLAAGLIALAGCGGEENALMRAIRRPTPPLNVDGDSLILRPDGLVNSQTAAIPDAVRAEMDAGRDAFRREEYDKAETHFHRIADDERNPASAIQEAMYYRGESLRLSGHYPKAADVYSALCNKYPSNPYREQSVQRMFDIANYWLEDSREEMREDKERLEGKRWVVWPRFVSFEKSKPLLDREGRAVQIMEQVRLHDLNGPLADRALFMCGVLKMYHENYREADYYFTQVPQRHPNSALAPRSIELAIFCKHMSTGGSDYDGRKAAEARKLVERAVGNYPELAHDKDKREFLEKQRKSIDLQQAEQDFKKAELYRRLGHPGSAYFYYELVQRRYPGTVFAEKARERWASLREQVARDQK